MTPAAFSRVVTGSLLLILMISAWATLTMPERHRRENDETWRLVHGYARHYALTTHQNVPHVEGMHCARVLSGEFRCVINVSIQVRGSAGISRIWSTVYARCYAAGGCVRDYDAVQPTEYRSESP